MPIRPLSRHFHVSDAWNVSPQILGGIALRTLVVYVLLLIGIRLAGKRQIAQLTPFDLVVLLLISNAVQNAMTGPDISLTGGIVAAATLLCANSLVSAATYRWKAVNRAVEGAPVVLVTNGQIDVSALRRERMTEEDLMEALREHEVGRLEEIAIATLEVDGSVSVIRSEPNQREKVRYSRKKLVRHHKRPN